MSSIQVCCHVQALFGNVGAGCLSASVLCCVGEGEGRVRVVVVPVLAHLGHHCGDSDV